jgi:hypothetical protein
VTVRELIAQLQRLGLPDATVYATVNGGYDEYGGFVRRVHADTHSRDGHVTIEAKP